MKENQKISKSHYFKRKINDKIEKCKKKKVHNSHPHFKNNNMFSNISNKIQNGNNSSYGIKICNKFRNKKKYNFDYIQFMLYITSNLNNPEWDIVKLEKYNFEESDCIDQNDFLNKTINDKRLPFQDHSKNIDKSNFYDPNRYLKIFSSDKKLRNEWKIRTVGFRIARRKIVKKFYKIIFKD